MKNVSSSAFKKVSDWRNFLKTIENANNAELGRMMEVMEHEKMISDKVVREGFEKRGRLKNSCLR